MNLKIFNIHNKSHIHGLSSICYADLYNLWYNKDIYVIY